MSDIGEDFKLLKEIAKAKKIKNYSSSLNFLNTTGLKFTILSENNGHVRLGDYDIWLTTGKFINRTTKKKGRGILNLTNLVFRKQQNEQD